MSNSEKKKLTKFSRKKSGTSQKKSFSSEKMCMIMPITLTVMSVNAVFVVQCKAHSIIKIFALISEKILTALDESRLSFVSFGNLDVNCQK